MKASLAAVTVALGVPSISLALVAFSPAAPQAVAQTGQCPDSNMTSAFVDTYSDEGVVVQCVPVSNVGHDCFAPKGGANGPKLPAGTIPEGKSIYGYVDCSHGPGGQGAPPPGYGNPGMPPPGYRY